MGMIARLFPKCCACLHYGAIYRFLTKTCLTDIYVIGSPPSHLEGSSTSVGRPGNCQSPVLAIENVDVRQRILFDVPPDGVHVS